MGPVAVANRMGRHPRHGPTVAATSHAHGVMIMRRGGNVAIMAPGVTGESTGHEVNEEGRAAVAACIRVPAAGEGAVARGVSGSGR